MEQTCEAGKVKLYVSHVPIFSFNFSERNRSSSLN